ncbi:MAG: MerR family transcriptional regulator [Sandaracinaceae bacterium]|nr:MerR family transcriptional regulator [Sandaracinaceae bacterium]
MPVTRSKTRLPITRLGKSHPSLIPPSPKANDATGLKVGDLAKRTGKSIRALHLYEELGLLEPKQRSKGGFRLYSEEAVQRVFWITRLQEIGFSLPEIRDLLSNWKASASAPQAMQRVREVYHRKLEEARLQLAKLRSLVRELEESLAYLETCMNCEPERVVSDCLACERHSCEFEERPAFIVGLH